MNGTIKRLVADKGFGFIVAGDKEFFFHRSGAQEFDALREGSKVRFEEESSPKGPRASNVQAVD